MPRKRKSASKEVLTGQEETERPKYVYKSKISTHLTCSICLDIFLNPIRFHCGHIFCGSCVDSIREKGQCPNDRSEINWRLAHLDLLAVKMLGIQQVYCSNRQNSCKWEGMARDLPSHLAVCEYGELPECVQKVRQPGKEENFMEDEEVAEHFEREGLGVDLITRTYFKNPELVKSFLGSRSESMTVSNPSESLGNGASRADGQGRGRGSETELQESRAERAKNRKRKSHPEEQTPEKEKKADWGDIQEFLELMKEFEDEEQT